MTKSSVSRESNGELSRSQSGSKPGQLQPLFTRSKMFRHSKIMTARKIMCMDERHILALSEYSVTPLWAFICKKNYSASAPCVLVCLHSFRTKQKKLLYHLKTHKMCHWNVFFPVNHHTTDGSERTIKVSLCLWDTELLILKRKQIREITLHIKSSFVWHICCLSCLIAHSGTDLIYMYCHGNKDITHTCTCTLQMCEGAQ